ncbi:putative armadillo-like helical, CLASP domain, TOG domain-containing protein, partial [Tanacetum coccineum]
CIMMSETALRDLNLLPKSERTNETSSKDILAKPYVENVKGKQRISIVTLDEPTSEVADCGAEVVAAEVEYIESEKLDNLENLDESLKVLVTGLESKDWVLLCDTLNNVRRLAIYHKEALQDILENVVSLVVKALKNPRSAVCKTAIMTSADIFKAFGDSIIDSVDPLLVVLLLKSSQDKRFVCEAAEKALIALTIWVSPVLLLPKLQPYLKNRNPRIRAKASLCVSRCVPRLGAEGIKDYGIDKLIQIASSQLSDKLPESREAARALLVELQTAYEKSLVLAPEQGTPPDQPKAPEQGTPPEQPQAPEQGTLSDQPQAMEHGTSSDQPQVHSWEQFCESNLPKLSAQAVLRVTSSKREVSLGIASEVVVVTIVVAMIFLFVGIVILIIIYVYIAARVLSVTISGNGVGTGNGMVEISTNSRMCKDDVENLPSFSYTKASLVTGDDDCAVCLDNYTVGDKCRLLPVCNHKFHAHCVDLWLLSTPLCPICRTPTTPVATVTVSDFTNSGGSVSSVEESENQQLDNIVIELSGSAVDKAAIAVKRPGLLKTGKLALISSTSESSTEAVVQYKLLRQYTHSEMTSQTFAGGLTFHNFSHFGIRILLSVFSGHVTLLHFAQIDICEGETIHAASYTDLVGNQSNMKQ